jgi:predicted aldo/keto reductase-like oxidoreductase
MMMQYVEFGKRSGLKVSRVSFGAMRFGTEPDSAIQTIRTAIDNGINYIDTSPGYYRGMSEELLGEALQDGYREKVYISSKCSLPREYDPKNYTVKKVRKVIDQSLKRLKVDYIDFFQLWLVYSYENFLDMCGPDRHLDAITQAIDEGIVKHTGITGHPPPGDFQKMFEDELFEVCTLSYNYMQRKMEPDIQTLADMGVGVIVMNPAAGGMLAEPSPELAKLLPGSRSSVEVAYRYVLGTPGVSTIIAGMDTPEHAAEDTAIGDMAPLAKEEQDQIMAGIDKLNEQGETLCSKCDYCKECPEGIRISNVFGLYIRHKIFGMEENAKKEYRKYLEKKDWAKAESPEKCVECGKCEEICPNNIPIIEQLKEAHESLRSS